MAELLGSPRLLLVALPLIVVAWITKKFYDAYPPKLDFPIVGTPDGDLQAAIIEGYKKVRG